MLTLLEDYEKLKKEKTQMNQENSKKIQDLQQKNNKLQTDYENAKIETALQMKKAKEYAETNADANEKIKSLTNTLAAKT